MTPDSSSNSTCTLAANPRGSNASLLTRASMGTCSNLDDTPTPSNRASPEPHAPKPQVVVEEFSSIGMAGVPISPKSPRLPSRTVSASEAQAQGSLGYGPLSHIKLPYSTPVMQRMQQTVTGSGTTTNGAFIKKDKSTFYATSAGQSNSEG